MSMRPTEAQAAVHPLRAELEEARAFAQQTAALAALPQELTAPEVGLLTHAEVQTASLGVSPEAWKPIAMLNAAHYSTLLQSNSLAPELAAKLESFKAVAAGQ
jgi:hypothetical protein